MHNKFVRLSRRCCGGVLILVLIVVSAMTVMSFGLAYRTRIEIQLAGDYARRTQCHYLALSGIERAKAALASKNLADHNLTILTRFSADTASEALFQSCTPDETLKKAQLKYCIKDEFGYLNLNASDPAAWQNLGISKAVCAAILDWIDPDDHPGSDGAESDEYQGLQPPYKAKNKPILTLKELIFLRSVSADIYQASGPLIDAIFDPTKAASVSLLKAFTVYGDGRINANSAPEYVLAALPGIDETVPPVISAYLAGADALLGTEDDNQIINTEDFERIESLDPMHIELLEQYCRFDSDHFRIYSYAQLPDGYDCCITATVTFDSDRLKVVSMEFLQ